MAGARQAVGEARRIVVKVGSSSLTTAAGGLDADRVDALVDVLAKSRSGGERRSSSSPPAPSPPGSPRWACAAAPGTWPGQQAAASVGQGLLVARYTASFARYGVRVGQVLLTTDDISRRAHHRNAYRTLDKLLAMGALPDRQRERHRRHRRDPLRRQRPARRPRRPPRPRRPAGPALRRRRRLRRRPQHARAPRRIAEVRGPRGPRAASRSAAPARRASAPAAWSPRSRPPGSRPAAGIPVVLTSAVHAADALAGGDTGTYFHRHRQALRRPAAVARSTPPPRRASLTPGRRRGARGRRAAHLAAAGRDHRRRGRLRRGRPGGPARRRRARAVARGLVNFDAKELPRLLGRSTRELARGARRRRTSARSSTGTTW